MRKRLSKVLLGLAALFLIIAGGGWIWLWHSEAGAEWAWRQAREQLFSITGADLDGRLSGTLGKGVNIDGLRYRDEQVSASAERAELAIHLGLFPAVLTVRKLSLQDIEVEISESGEKPPGTKATANFAAPIPIIVEELRIDRAAVSFGDVRFPLERLVAAAQWSEALSLEIRTFESPAVSGALDLKSSLSEPYALQSNIRIDRVGLPGDIRASQPWLTETLEAGVSVSGDARALDLEGRLEWPEWLPQATFRGRIDSPFADRAWRLDATVAKALVPESLLGEELAAALAGGDQPSLSDIRLEASGENATFEFNGSALAFSPWTSSATVNLEGRFEDTGIVDWSLAGEAQLAAEGWPTADIGYSLAGGQDRLAASVSAPELFGGSLTASAATQDGEGRPWNAELIVRNVSTPALVEVVSPHLEQAHESRLAEVDRALQAETLSAHVLASGRLEPLEITAQIHDLEGLVRGRNISATGQVAYTDGDISAQGLALQSGASRVVLDGALQGPPGLELAVEIATLDDILPGSAGSVTGRVRYAFDRNAGLAGSNLRVDLEGRNIRISDWSVGELTVSEPAKDLASPLAISLQAQSITGPPGTLSSASAVLEGDLDRHSLTLGAEFDGSRAVATLTGGLSGPERDAWQGKLDSLALFPSGAQAWKLRAPAVLRYDQQLAIEGACLTPGGEPELCFDFEHRRDGSQRGTVSLTSVSVDLLARMAEWPLGFTQRLSGSMDWSLTPGLKPSASAEFDVSEGAVIDTADARDLINTGAGIFSFTLDNGRLHSGDLDIPLDSGLIDIDFSVPDVLAGEASQLQGWMRVTLEDLDPIANFIPELVQTDGELRADLSIAGTAGSPILGGVIKLHNGRTQVLAPGLRLSEIELVGKLEAGNQVRIEGSFLAGEGRGELRADADLSDPLRPAIDMQIKGQGLTLVEVPDLQLLADTDLAASWQGKSLHLSGQIHVPTARFAPRYLPSDTALESPDVVVVAGGEYLPAEPSEASPDWRIDGELDISAGDNVVVDLDLARASLTGQARFMWSGPPIPIASGQYDLKGEIQAYGQTLEITRASIRFPDVPADNPHLEIRAERRIYGNSLISHAGVLVHGTLKRPVTEPYTVPVTNADRARALLITGSDFNYEQGTGAVNVGTYISPRLYMSYGVGLFEEGNVITVRYDLKRNFGVKATSGQDDTGIDISYTIER